VHINTGGRLNVIYRTELDQKIVNRKKSTYTITGAFGLLTIINKELMKSDAWDIPLVQNVTSTIYNNILLCK